MVNILLYLGLLMFSPFLLIGTIVAIKEIYRVIKTLDMDNFVDRFVLIFLITASLLLIIAGLLW